MSKRSVLGLTYVFEALKEQVDIDTLLSKHGLTSGSLDPTAHIDIAVELAILNDLVDFIPDDDAGISVGAIVSLAGYGALGMLLMSCDTPFQATQIGVKYQKLTYLYGELSLKIFSDTSALCYLPYQLPEKVQHFIVDRDISGTYRLIEDLRTYMNLDIGLTELWLPYPKPSNATSVEKRYNCPIIYDQPEARFYMANEDLQRPFPTANKTACRLYASQCDQLLERLVSEDDKLSPAVKSHLSLFHNNYPNALQVADTFGFSERTLRRKLKSEGNSFQVIMDETKYEKAQQYLKQGKESIDEIALKLGYAEAASFIRAFQRWSGMTPAKFRRYKGPS